MAMDTAAIKAVEEGGELYLDVLGLPFGTDRQGQTFDADTNIDLTPGAEIPVYYHHGFAERAAKSVQRIGKAIYSGADSAGHWFRAQLDKTSDTARKIFEDAKAGMARASSDSASHLVRPFGIVGKPGKVTNWPIFAMSLMDAATYDTAVNPRAVALAAAKAMADELEADTATTQTDTGTLSESGEVLADAAKAGATFAKRNRDRLIAIKAALDEMLNEIPEEVAPGTEATVAAKTGDPETKRLDDVLQLPREVIQTRVREMVRNAMGKTQ